MLLAIAWRRFSLLQSAVAACPSTSFVGASTCRLGITRVLNLISLLVLCAVVLQSTMLELLLLVVLEAFRSFFSSDVVVLLELVLISFITSVMHFLTTAMSCSLPSLNLLSGCVARLARGVGARNCISEEVARCEWPCALVSYADLFRIVLSSELVDAVVCLRVVDSCLLEVEARDLCSVSSLLALGLRSLRSLRSESLVRVFDRLSALLVPE